MPRPAILPTIKWSDIFNSGQSFDEWITQGEFPDHRDRMKKMLEELPIDSALQAWLAGLSRDVNIVAIAEDWCGDVVRHVPVLQKLVHFGTRVHVRYISRAQHPDVFARYLTNGGEAIPKFVFLSDKWVECGNWGPMPEQCRRLISRGKAAGDVGAARKRVSLLYEADPKCEAAVCELADLIGVAASSVP